MGVAAVLLNAGLSVTTAPYFGYKGLALSASIASLFNAGTLAWLARGALGGLEFARVAGTFTKTLAAAAAMAGVAWAAMNGLESALPGSSLAAQIVRLAGAIGLAVLTLGLGAQVLGIREFEAGRDAITARLRRMFNRPA